MARGTGSGGSRGGAAAGRSGGGSANARDLKMYLAHGMWREHSYALIAVGVIVVAFFSAAVLQFSTSKEHVYRVEVTDPVLLQRVFRSGEPWVVLCAKPDDVVPDVFGKVAPRLVDKSFVGVLDCTQRLPQSGKSVLQRYGIKPSVTPTVFTVANGEAPKQIFLDHLQTSKALARRVVAQTKKAMAELLTTAHLDQRCLRKRTCVLVLRGAKFTPYERQWLDTLMHQHRALAFAFVDATRLRLSIESQLPPFVAGEHRLVLFRRVSSTTTGSSDGKRQHQRGGVTAKAFRNIFDALPVGMFLDEHATSSSSGDGFKALAKAPTLARRPASTGTRSTRASRARKQQTPAADEVADESQHEAQPANNAQEDDVSIVHASGGDDDDDDVELIDLDGDDNEQ